LKNFQTCAAFLRWINWPDMMIKKLTRYNLLLLAVLAVCLTPRMVLGGLIGEPAPALNVHEWVMGGPVEIKPGTNIFVLEILETKFPASRESITNLNEIQRRFNTNGVVVVGVSDESVGVIKEYVQRHGTNIEFALAADNGRHTALAYMNPINRHGLPYDFIIGTNGDLLWHGVPQMEMLEDALTNILTGKYNEAAAAKMDLALHQMEQYLALARQGSDRTKMAGQRLLDTRTNDVPLLLDMADKICTVPRLAVRDFNLADEALKQAENLAPTNPPEIKMVRAVWLFESGQREAGLELAKRAVASTQVPEEKTRWQMMVKRMEERMVAKQADQDNGATNAPSAPEKSDGAQTGQGANSAGKP
jgi:hypothetical protein